MNAELLQALAVVFAPALAALLLGAWLAHRWLRRPVAPRADSRYPLRRQGAVALLALLLACALGAGLAAIPRPAPAGAEFAAFHYPGSSLRGLIVQLPAALGLWLCAVPVLQRLLLAPSRRADPEAQAGLLIRGMFCLVGGLIVNLGLGGVVTAATPEGMIETGGFGPARTSSWADLRGWFLAEGETRDGEFRPHAHVVVDFAPGGRWTLGLRPFFELERRPECLAVLRARTGTEPVRVREAPPY